VEALSYRHNSRFDLTAGKRYTLSDQTAKVVKHLTMDVHVVAFYKSVQEIGQPDRAMAEDILRRYATLSSRFRYEIVDPDRDPAKAKRYGITTYGTTVLTAESQEEKISEVEEEKLTNALIKVTRAGKRKIYFVTGHGEADLNSSERTGYSTITGEIEKANYEVKPLLLLRAEAVPEDAAILVTAGPKKDLVASELSLIQKYINRGGKVLFLLDPFTAPALTPFLKSYGIVRGENIIVDQVARLFGRTADSPVVSTYSSSHPITREFQSIATSFPYTHSLDTTSPEPKGITVEKLALTSPFPASWAETDRARLEKGEAVFEEGKDLKGPVAVAVVATVTPAVSPKTQGKETTEKASSDKTSVARLVVFGNSGFISNKDVAVLGNRDFFLNTISWLAEEETLIAIRPKEGKSTPLFLSATQGRLAFWIPVVILPALIIATGVGVTLRRRWVTP